MNANLIGSGIGALLTLAAIIPTNLMDSPSPTATAANQADTTLQQGNLVISTVPGNAWVRGVIEASLQRGAISPKSLLGKGSSPCFF